MLAATVFIAAFAAYFAVGLSTDEARSRELFTTWDHAIPFLPWTIHPYWLVFTAPLYPVFCIQSRSLFRRTALAYAVLVALAMLTFMLFPVTSLRLRADVSGLDPSAFSIWALRLTYAADPPFNQFPSLHMAAMTLCALAASRAKRVFGWITVVPVLSVAVAICTLKQHFIWDGVAGLFLALVVYAGILHPWKPEPGEERIASTWRGPVAYAALHAAGYVGMYALFLTGWRPF